MARPLPWILLVLAACGSPRPVSPERLQQEERRLLAPYLAGGDVVCAELELEMTGNFAVDKVGQPAVDPRWHKAHKQESADYVDTTWTNTLGDPQHAFTVTVGEPDQLTDKGWVPGKCMRFKVVNQVRMRVHAGRHALVLDARCSGKTMVVQAGQAHAVGNFRIHDGVLQCN